MLTLFSSFYICCSHIWALQTRDKLPLPCLVNGSQIPRDNKALSQEPAFQMSMTQSENQIPLLPASLRAALRLPRHYFPP